MPDDLTALRLDRLSRDYTAASRFNTNHAPPGSATGGQFTSASGAQQQPAKDGRKAHPQHGPTKRELLATAAEDRKKAGRLQHSLAVLEQEQADAAKAAQKAAGKAGGGSGGQGGGAAARAQQAHQHRSQAAKHRTHAHHHRKAGNHTRANHHQAAAHHHAHAATLLERIATLKVRIHELLDAAAKATAQANRM